MALDMNHEKSLKALYKRYPGVPDADSGLGGAAGLQTGRDEDAYF